MNLWKKNTLLLSAVIGLPLLALIVYISLYFNLSPATNAVIGAVLFSIIGYLAPRPPAE